MHNRRSVVRASAWTLPALTAALSTSAAAASCPTVAVTSITVSSNGAAIPTVNVAVTLSPAFTGTVGVSVLNQLGTTVVGGGTQDVSSAAAVLIPTNVAYSAGNWITGRCIRITLTRPGCTNLVFTGRAVLLDGVVSTSVVLPGILCPAALSYEEEPAEEEPID